jgi:hypothetical protein
MRVKCFQDEPLPHELRPLPVLTMTMNYLLAEIADVGEDGKWAEWYDFLWNRTRSIRKVRMDLQTRSCIFYYSF